MFFLEFFGVCQRLTRRSIALSVAVGAAWVDGRGVFSAALSNQLVEAVAEVLDLTGAKDAAHSHQVGPPLDAVDVTTAP